MSDTECPDCTPFRNSDDKGILTAEQYQFALTKLAEAEGITDEQRQQRRAHIESLHGG